MTVLYALLLKLRQVTAFGIKNDAPMKCLLLVGSSVSSSEQQIIVIVFILPASDKFVE